MYISSTLTQIPVPTLYQTNLKQRARIRTLATFELGGDEEDRTPDPLRAKQVLSQLSYIPKTPGR